MNKKHLINLIFVAILFFLVGFMASRVMLHNSLQEKAYNDISSQVLDIYGIDISKPANAQNDLDTGDFEFNEIETNDELQTPTS